MLDHLLSKLPPDQAQAGAVIIRLRPPDLEALSVEREIVDDEEIDEDEEIVEGGGCPVCDGEHEELRIPPEAATILAHFLDVLKQPIEPDQESES